MNYNFGHPSSFRQKLFSASPLYFLPIATIVTFLFSGYSAILDNNIYHLPILMRDYDLPQFRDDPFVQSLRHFSSGFWIAFAGIGQFLSVKVFLAAWLFLAHFAFLASGLHFARSLGYKDNRLLNLFLLILCSSSLAFGVTVGGGGLMINNFSHSELANASLVFGLSFALRGRYGPAALATCITFFLNAFMAVWMIPSLSLLALYQINAGKLTVRRFVTDSLWGSVLGLVFLWPPLSNILKNPEVSGGTPFSYRDYLWEYFPLHFFFSSLRLTTYVRFGALVFILLLTFNFHHARSREFLAIIAGALLLMVVAFVAPLVTDARLILNLHLVRGASLLALLAVISAGLVACQWIFFPDNTLRRWLGPVLLGLLLLPIAASAILVAVFLLERVLRTSTFLEGFFARKIAWTATWVFLGLCVALLPIRIFVAQKEAAANSPTITKWERIGTWANRETAADAVFQVPVEGALGFSYTARRQIWFTEKYGAAVMWSPSYHDIWKSRMFVLNTPSLIDIVEKLRGHVDYIADRCATSFPEPPVFKDGDICVYRLLREQRAS